MKVTGPCPENVMSRAVYKQLHKHRTDVKRCLSERYPAVAAMPSESNSNGRLILKSETLTGRAAHIGQMLADRVAAQILADVHDIDCAYACRCGRTGTSSTYSRA